jgi:hypothetical protein
VTETGTRPRPPAGPRRPWRGRTSRVARVTRRWWAAPAGWAVSRLALLVAVLLISLVAGVDPALRADQSGRWLVERVTWWDSWHYLRIAEVGYLPPGLPCCDQAFFPGYPALMAALAPVTGGSLPVAGWLISLLAGSVAAGLLWRLGEDRGPGIGRRAVILLAVAPFGVFFGAVYTEALFLALALGGWLAADRRRWWLAGSLAAGASLVRINGLFLAVALAVTYLLQLRADHRAARPEAERPEPAGGSTAPRPAGALRRRWPWPRPDVAALGLPFVATGAFFGYLAVRSGSWDAWQRAQETGWVRRAAWPWQGLASGWRDATSAGTIDLVISRWSDLLSVVCGMLLVAVLLRLRRWAESVFIGLSVSVLVCSTLLTSASRYALAWFPGFLLLAELAARAETARRAGRWIWLGTLLTCVPLLVWLSAQFAAHRWVG